MWTCLTCGTSNQLDARTCARCGTSRRNTTQPIPAIKPDGESDASQVVARAPVAQGIDSLHPTDDAPADKTVKMDLSESPVLSQHTLVESEAPSLEAMRDVLEKMESSKAATQMIQTQEMVRHPTLAIDASLIPGPRTVEELPMFLPSATPEIVADQENASTAWLSPVFSFAAGLVVAAGACVIAWYGFGDMMPVQDEDETPTRPAAVTIPSGPFLRGLSNDYRLMFGDICPKIADDPKTECKEEIALAGEYPMKEVVVPAFRIDAWEVSNADWKACVRAEGCSKIAWNECANWSVRGLVPFLETPQELRGPTRPVVCVNRDEAEAYCKHAGGRLPTHDEWEKAARGADAFLFPWGTNWSSTASNWGERDMTRVIVAGQLDGFATTSPVWSFDDSKSPYGALNMAGNVAEWVAAGEGSLGASARGGSWRSDPLGVRSTVRFPLKKDNRRTDVGFRCAFDE